MATEQDRLFLSDGSDACRIDLTGVVRYLVSRDAVQVDQIGDIALEDAHRLQRGAPLAAQLLLRGIAPLHAAAVRTDAGAVLIAGRSASGKSTMAALMAQRGHGVLSEDLTGLELQAGQAVVVPGYAGVTLWRDVMVRLGYAVDAYQPVHPELDKYVVTPAAPCTDRPVPVRAIFVLTVRNDPAMTIGSITGMEKFQIIGHNTYNTRLTDALVSRDAFFALSTALAASVPVWQIRRPRGVWTAEQIADRVESLLG